jgi:putative PIN family toxin of toxin-antitoxin system
MQSMVSGSPSKLVLDTNIVLDWLVFDDPSTRELQTAIHAKQIEVVTNELAIDELRRVLAYPQLSLNAMHQTEHVARYRSQTIMASMPPGFSREKLLLPQGFPACSDHDDQHFLALAFHANVSGVLTRDKALLKLRKRAARFSVRIGTLRELNSFAGATS